MSALLQPDSFSSPATSAKQGTKFKKVLLLSYVESDFEAQVRPQLMSMAEQIVATAEGNEEVMELLADADCLLVEPGIPVGPSLFNAAPELKFVCIYGTDYSRVDVATAARRGITVCNTPGYSTGAVAEFVFGAILAHIRGLVQAQSRVCDGRHTDLGAPGSEIRNKRFGVIGLGRIGRRVAEIAKHGFDADVCYWSRTRKADIEQTGVRYAEINELLGGCDLISIHAPLTATTQHLLNADRIANIKPGAALVLLSPTELVDLDALEVRLDHRDLTVILDHTDELAPERRTSLARYENCVLYPAIACTTQEARHAKRAMLLQNIEGFLAGCPINQVVVHA